MLQCVEVCCNVHQKASWVLCLCVSTNNVLNELRCACVCVWNINVLKKLPHVIAVVAIRRLFVCVSVCRILTF